MEWTTSEIQNKNIAKISIFIFLSVVLLGAFEVLPLVVASLIGVVSMITFKVLSVRQVLRSVDNNLLLLIVTSLALRKSYSSYWSCKFFIRMVVKFLDGSSPLTILLCFYALVSLTTNFISNNACAVFSLQLQLI